MKNFIKMAAFCICSCIVFSSCTNASLPEPNGESSETVVSHTTEAIPYESHETENIEQLTASVPPDNFSHYQKQIELLAPSVQDALESNGTSVNSPTYQEKSQKISEIGKSLLEDVYQHPEYTEYGFNEYTDTFQKYVDFQYIDNILYKLCYRGDLFSSQAYDISEYHFYEPIQVFHTDSKAILIYYVYYSEFVLPKGSPAVTDVFSEYPNNLGTQYESLLYLHFENEDNNWILKNVTAPEGSVSAWNAEDYMTRLCSQSNNWFLMDSQ